MLNRACCLGSPHRAESGARSSGGGGCGRRHGREAAASTDLAQVRQRQQPVKPTGERVCVRVYCLWRWGTYLNRGSMCGCASVHADMHGCMCTCTCVGCASPQCSCLEAWMAACARARGLCVPAGRREAVWKGIGYNYILSPIPRLGCQEG